MPGVLYIILGHMSDVSSNFWCITLITLSIGFSGSVTMTNMQNPIDLSPNYCGTIFGFLNFVSSTSGFLTPLVTAHFTEEKVKQMDLKLVDQLTNQNLYRVHLKSGIGYF